MSLSTAPARTDQTRRNSYSARDDTQLLAEGLDGGKSLDGLAQNSLQTHAET